MPTLWTMSRIWRKCLWLGVGSPGQVSAKDIHREPCAVPGLTPVHVHRQISPTAARNPLMTSWPARMSQPSTTSKEPRPHSLYGEKSGQLPAATFEQAGTLTDVFWTLSLGPTWLQLQVRSSLAGCVSFWPSPTLEHRWNHLLPQQLPCSDLGGKAIWRCALLLVSLESGYQRMSQTSRRSKSNGDCSFPILHSPCEIHLSLARTHSQ